MTPADILRMAREAGFMVSDEAWLEIYIGSPDGIVTLELSAFAALVAAHEREICALLCENEAVENIGPGDEAYNEAITHCVKAIRERGS